MVLVILALLLNSALLMGNEFAVAAFIHPSLSGKDHRSNLVVIQHFANLYGRVMPIWMGVTTALHIIVCVMAWFYSPLVFSWLLAAALIWIIVIPYSLFFPVPLNNQVKEWDLNNLPANWEVIRNRWDIYNWIRVMLLMTAFIALSIGFRLTVE
ncbi:DUF1772 domain-containing protein [Oscillatoria sp. FACHB-1407]|uniref:DUF1772 domain-containing protein n=1 Tax=Oscillatoria sp. FACHB-1407 TaxID=2692847 RepID=UPI0016870F66|nr:DUF1772 domain-containing protein [Oscillatoria sp. FACHB-1407]MBD2461435.1 DUF1772 domain-containing protein [Oscillatoria sp. FACHB-1407]